MVLLETPGCDVSASAQNFTLPALSGELVSLEDFRGGVGLVVAFICNHCPYVIAQISDFVSDAEILRDIGVNVVAIMPNDFHEYPEDSPEKMVVFAETHNFGFPYLLDETQQVARSYGAVCTPDYFGFDRDLKLRYRGRLDNLRIDRQQERIPELVNTMKRNKDEERELEPQLPSMGCSIKWKQ